MTFIVVGFVLFIGFLLTSLMMLFSNYKKKFERSFSIKNTFPYELNIQNGFKENLLGNISLILSNIVLIIFLCNFDLASKNGYLIALLICGILMMLSFTVSVLASDKIKSSQVYIVPLNYLLSFAYSAVFALGTYAYYEDTKRTGYLVLLIIACLITLINIAIMLSPRLSNKIPYTEKVENGKTVIVRPNKIFLAYSQWITLFTFLVMTALSMIIMIMQK